MSSPSFAELARTLGDGCFLLGEFRAGHASLKNWVDREDGKCKSKLVAFILIETVSGNDAQSIKLYLNLPATTTDPAQVKIPWEKGIHYFFPLKSLKVEKGAISGSLDDRREVLPI